MKIQKDACGSEWRLVKIKETSDVFSVPDVLKLLTFEFSDKIWTTEVAADGNTPKIGS